MSSATCIAFVVLLRFAVDPAALRLTAESRAVNVAAGAGRVDDHEPRQQQNITTLPRFAAEIKHDAQWAPHVSRTAYHYCQHRLTFSNKHDFVPASTLMDAMFKNRPNVTIFVTGTNDGKELDLIFHKDWYRPRKAHVYGWEILTTTFEEATRKLQGHPELELNRAAVSESDGKLVNISGRGETAGIYEPGSHGFRFAHEQVPTIRWSSFANQKQISEVSYALIDVEGHEMSVIAGMDLQRLRHTFPVFQYELGGTWVDGRHAGNMTQADAAGYLTGLGYRIYLMGHTNYGVPVLSPVSPSIFKDARCVQERGRYYIQGNALAVLETAGEQMPWLAQVVDKMVANDAELP